MGVLERGRIGRWVGEFSRIGRTRIRHLGIVGYTRTIGHTVCFDTLRLLSVTWLNTDWLGTLLTWSAFFLIRFLLVLLL